MSTLTIRRRLIVLSQMLRVFLFTMPILHWGMTKRRRVRKFWFSNFIVKLERGAFWSLRKATPLKKLSGHNTDHRVIESLKSQFFLTVQTTDRITKPHYILSSWLKPVHKGPLIEKIQQNYRIQGHSFTSRWITTHPFVFVYCAKGKLINVIDQNSRLPSS